MFPLFLFFFGTAIGSFLTVIIDRLPRNISIVHGRSYCEACKQTLGPLDLIPVFSYLFLAGRCRYCKKRYGMHYLVLEILAGALFVVVYLATKAGLPYSDEFSFQFLASILYRCILVSTLFVIFFIDLKHSLIPLSPLIISLLVSLLFKAMLQPTLLFVSLLSGLGAFLFFLAIHLVTRGKGMGFGDVLFAFVMGFILGFPQIIVGVYIAFLTGASLSLILILTERKKLKSAIPFGPFLITGTLSCLLWGPQLTHAFFVLLRII